MTSEIDLSSFEKEISRSTHKTSSILRVIDSLNFNDTYCKRRQKWWRRRWRLIAWAAVKRRRRRRLTITKPLSVHRREGRGERRGIVACQLRLNICIWWNYSEVRLIDCCCCCCRCKGVITNCINVNIGCSFQSTRASLELHLEECLYKDKGIALWFIRCAAAG